MIVLQIYVDDILFGATIKLLCKDFKKYMHNDFKISKMRELTIFLELQIKRTSERIFIN